MEPDAVEYLHQLASDVVRQLIPPGWASDTEAPTLRPKRVLPVADRTQELLDADYLMLDARTAGRESRPGGGVVWMPVEHITHYAAFCVVGSMSLASPRTVELVARIQRIESRKPEAASPDQQAILDAEWSRAFVALDEALFADIEAAGCGRLLDLLVDVVGTDDPLHALRV